MARTSWLVALLCTAMLGGTVPVWGQGTGSISGHVTDASGAVLQGAQVELEPKAAPTVTNQQGEFTILNLAPGNYKLTVSYVGFSRSSKDIAVVAGQTADFSATLTAASQTQAVEVFAERGHGEAEAINRQFTSPNILQVLPVEVITSLPNVNIADALGRLPSVTLERDEGEGKYVQIRGLEPRLNNVTVNGVDVPSSEGGVRQIKLDSIPSNLVESVEISKTLSANQDGDAIGGSVNLVTKTAGEQPTLYINGIGGYTPIEGGRKLTEMDATVGQRFGASKKFGVLFGASYDWNGRGIDDIEPGITTNPFPAEGTQPVIPGIDLREYRYDRSRLGFAGSADYKLADGGGLYVRGLYSHFNNFGDRWVYSPTVNSYVSPTLDGPDGTTEFNAQIRRPIEVISSLAAGGKHVFAKSWLSYDLSISRSTEGDKGYSTATFDPQQDIVDPNTGVVTTAFPLNHIVYAVDRTNPHTPKLIPQGAANIFDVTQYYLAKIRVSNNFAAQLNLQGGISAAHTYNWGGHFGIFELGAKVRNAHKFQDAREDNYTTPNGPTSMTPDPALLLSNFPSSFRNPDYYDKTYAYGPTADYNKIRSFFNSNLGSGVFAKDDQGSMLNTLSNSYDLVERIAAGYLMNTLEFGRVRLQTGLRFENTSESVGTNQVQFDGSGNLITPVPRLQINSSYLDPLPTVQVRFALSHDSAIRAVYGRGIARPNFGDIPLFFNSDAGAMQVGAGNPYLKATHANNYDLLFEQTLRPLGLIQVGFFYKQLSNPIYATKTKITDPSQFGQTYVGYELDRPVNGTGAHLYGFEIAYQQHLTFLPGLLKGFGISANYGYTFSKTDSIPLRTDTPSLQRQAPNTWNISPTYDKGRLSARLGVSHNDANIFQYAYSDLTYNSTTGKYDSSPVPLGIKGPNGDVYLYAHTQVDAQGSFRMYRGLELIVSGLNLTNEVFGFYQGSPQFPIQREFYKPSYSFGLRFNLSNEPK